MAIYLDYVIVHFTDSENDEQYKATLYYDSGSSTWQKEIEQDSDANKIIDEIQNLISNT